MPLLTPENIHSLINSPQSSKARNILKSGHLWGFKEEASPNSFKAQALVLDKLPEPYRVSWNRENGEWHCECGSEEMCPHIAALLLKLAESRPDDNFLAQLRNHADAPPEDREKQLNPEIHQLFFTETEPLELKAVLALAPADALQDYLHRRPAAKQSIQRTEFPDISGQEWTIMAARAAILPDGSFGRPLPAGADVCTIPPAPLHELLQPSQPEERPLISLNGAVWHFEEASSVQLGFIPLPETADKSPLYKPEVSLSCGSGNIRGAVFRSGGGILVLDERTNTAAYLPEKSQSFWFLRLVLSRKALSAPDIRALPAGSRKIPEDIEVIFPELPETLAVLKPELTLLMSEQEEGFVDFLPRWKYGTVLVDRQNRTDMLVDFSASPPRPLGLRSPEEEERLVKLAEKILGAALSWRRGHYAGIAAADILPLRAEGQIPELLAEFAGPLMDAGIELQLKNRIIRRSGSLKIHTRKSGSVLEMRPQAGSKDNAFEALQLDEWLEKSGMVKTESSYFILTEKALRQLHFLRDHGLSHTGFLKTSPDNLGLIDAVYEALETEEETDRIYLQKQKEAYLKLTDSAGREPDKIPPPPDTFLAQLRPYQLQGYQWLHTLRKEKLGGCLADDMGLGKTIQTLSYLSRLKRDGQLGTSLIIGPVVTLGNWETEIQRFAPSLKTLRYSGPAGKRTLPPENSETVLIIVSYQTLRNDIEKFLEREWDHIILDEAHYVKNASSQTFKAIRTLRSRHRLSLTGTPLENHLSELWSQMSFLNPGILGSRHYFENHFIHPREQEEPSNLVIPRLSAIVAPFILRRKKSQVLQDLPPKEETIVRCEMTPLQAEAYESMRELYRSQVSGMLSENSGGRNKVEIFTIISKLRLLAIHPPLAGEPFSGVDSGKMKVLDSLLEKILEENHKILVFSQFLGALDKAEETCRAHNWQFARLTGSTKDRETPIQSFNNNSSIRIFLLSLKAGGVGINLTAADYVLLLDPWWNPSVEAQAIDRAHRLGQQKPVMAYRLISSKTIEERVLELQQKKKELTASILGDGEVPPLNNTEIMELFS